MSASTSDGFVLAPGELERAVWAGRIATTIGIASPLVSIVFIAGMCLASGQLVTWGGVSNVVAPLFLLTIIAGSGALAVLAAVDWWRRPRWWRRRQAQAEQHLPTSSRWMELALAGGVSVLAAALIALGVTTPAVRGPLLGIGAALLLLPRSLRSDLEEHRRWIRAAAITGGGIAVGGAVQLVSQGAIWFAAGAIAAATVVPITLTLLASASVLIAHRNGHHRAAVGRIRAGLGIVLPAGLIAGVAAAAGDRDLARRAADSAARHRQDTVQLGLMLGRSGELSAAVAILYAECTRRPPRLDAALGLCELALLHSEIDEDVLAVIEEVGGLLHRRAVGNGLEVIADADRAWALGKLGRFDAALDIARQLEKVLPRQSPMVEAAASHRLWAALASDHLLAERYRQRADQGDPEGAHGDLARGQALPEPIFPI